MAQPQGTGFSNLQNIIAANQGNTLGSSVQQGVQKNISGLQTALGQSQQQFQQDVNNANLGTQGNQSYVQNLLNSITNAQSQAPAANAAAPQAQTAPPPVTGSTATNPLMQIRGATAQAAAPMPTSQPSTPSPTVTALSAPSTSQQAAPAPAAQPTQAPGGSETSGAGSFGFSSPTSGTQQTSMTGQGFTAPNAGDIAKFAQFEQGSYTGPKQLNNYAQLLAQGQQLGNLSQSIGTQGGLQGLLQQYAGGPGYNRGEQTLDTLLLGATGQPQLKNIVQATQGAGQLVPQAESQAAAQAAQQATQNQAFGQNVQNQIQAGQNPILQAIQGNLNTLQGQEQNYATNVQQIQALLNQAPGTAAPTAAGAASTGNLTSNQLALQALQNAAQQGQISADQIQQIQNLMPQIQAQGGNLQSILQQAYTANLPQNYSMQQAATGQQAAQLNALAQLAGQQSQFPTYGGIQLPGAYFDMSKILSQVGATGQAPAAGPGPGANNNTLYNLANVYGSPALVPIAATAGVGQTAKQAGTGVEQIAQGNIGGGVQNIATAPTSGLSEAVNVGQSGVNDVGQSLDRLAGGSPLPGQVLSTATAPGSIALNNLSGYLGNQSNAVGTNVNDILKGNFGQAAQQAALAQLAGLQNIINTPQQILGGVGGGVGNIISDIGSAIGGLF